MDPTAILEIARLLQEAAPKMWEIALLGVRAHMVEFFIGAIAFLLACAATTVVSLALGRKERSEVEGGVWIVSMTLSGAFFAMGVFLFINAASRWVAPEWWAAKLLLDLVIGGN
jgi:hypothetical protein